MQYIIPTIFTAQDKFTRPVMRMESALVSLTTLGGVAGAKLERSLGRISTMSMEVATSAAMIGAAILIPLGLATKAAIDFEKQMGNVATLVDTAKESMDAMGQAVLDIASRVPVKVADLTESLYQVRSAGVSAGDAMHVLETSARLSVAGLSSATDATKAVTSAMVSFKAQGLSTDQIANSFFLTVRDGKTKMDAINEAFGQNAPIVAAAGISLQEFNAATAAMTNTGLSAAASQTSLAGAVRALIKPTSEMTDALQTMGYIGVDAGQKLINNMGGIVGALEALKKAAPAAGDNINKALGRAQALNALTILTGNQSGAFHENMKHQTDLIGANNEAFYKQLGTTASQAQLAKNNLEILSITVGTLLLPMLNSAAKSFVSIIKPLTNWIHNHRELSRVIIKSVFYFGLFTAFVAAGSFIIGTFTKAIWLWRFAQIGVNTIIGITAGLLNMEMIPSLIKTTSYFYAYAGGTYAAVAGTRVLNTATSTLLGTLGSIALVVGALALAYDHFYKKAAKVSTDKFNAAKNSLPANQQQSFEDKYTTSASNASMKSIFSLSDQDAHALDSMETANYNPNQDDSTFSKMAKGAYTQADSIVKVYNTVNVDKDGNVKIDTTANNSFGIPISIPKTYGQ